MKDLRVRRFEMFVRVCDFLTAQLAIFTKGSLAAQLIDQFVATVREIQQLRVSQASGLVSARSYARNRTIARKALRQIMETMNWCAQGISVTVPGFDQRFRL